MPGDWTPRLNGIADTVERATCRCLTAPPRVRQDTADVLTVDGRHLNLDGHAHPHLPHPGRRGPAQP